LLGVAGLSTGDGVDLTPWLRADRNSSPRGAAFGRRQPYSGAPDLYYRRHWPEKWIGELGASRHEFNLETDARELPGVAGHPTPDDLSASQAGSAAERKRGRVVDEETKRALRALGYAE